MRSWPWTALAFFAAAAAWVLVYDPTDQTEDPTGPCAWHMLTGINGPSCGGTRAFYSLLHGDIVDAARYHLPATLAAPFLLYWWLRAVLTQLTGIKMPSLRVNRWTLIGYGVFFIVFTTVLRNLPYGPFPWFDIPNLTPRGI